MRVRGEGEGEGIRVRVRVKERPAKEAIPCWSCMSVEAIQRIPFARITRCAETTGRVKG